MNIEWLKRVIVGYGSQAHLPPYGCTNYPGGHQYEHNGYGRLFSNISGPSYSMHTDRFVNRIYLEERFKQKPALNAVIGLPGSDSTSPTATALAAYTIANKDFEVLGTNMTTALVTFASTGGIILTTAGANADFAVLLPHLDTDQTAWTATKWTTSTGISFETVVTVPAGILTKTIVWAGFKLTNVHTIATDNDQVYFRFSTVDSDTTWRVISTRSDAADVNTDTGVTMAASTTYALRILVDGNLIPHCYINGTEVAVLAALTTAVDLKPYIGIMASGTTPGAKALTIRALACGRN